MSVLSVFTPDLPQQPYKVLTHGDDIVRTLAADGITLEHQPHDVQVRHGGDPSLRDAALAPWLNDLSGEHAVSTCTLIDVAHQGAEEHPLASAQWAAERVLIAVIAGRLQVGVATAERVHLIQCEKSDRLTLPAGVTWWWDAGTQPFCMAVIGGAEAGATLGASAVSFDPGAYPRLEVY